ncbi:uncharacterized protein ACHE_50409S [Aspergillus chevalieri]|uniref:Uncharacterized protein n=1 Tax=Aspergillus chevalieri TaxID=182096 RepID=A0A7R7ZPY6_ASPCH|nr:uncharacterized protein ACHE_50409S [Aspergillus chevalieri]BCR89211.1 hypothetical protein ACHE_50409S [Aspergillus chevalieri]
MSASKEEQTIEFCCVELDTAESVVSRLEETSTRLRDIFPAPTSPAAAHARTIAVSKRHLWGLQVITAAAIQTLTIAIENLREITRNMKAEGYTPA